MPIGAVQYDSWWYYKGPNSGVQLWEPEPSTVGGAAGDVMAYSCNPCGESLLQLEANTCVGRAVGGPPSTWYVL